jgi:hypothetical protein
MPRIEGTDQIRRWIQHHQARAETLVNLLASNLFQRIQELTPVDTGRARAGWRMEAAPGGSYVILNDVEYIICLENGTSRQAPHGMVSVALAEKELHTGQAALYAG